MPVDPELGEIILEDLDGLLEKEEVVFVLKSRWEKCRLSFPVVLFLFLFLFIVIVALIIWVINFRYHTSAEEGLVFRLSNSGITAIVHMFRIRVITETSLRIDSLKNILQYQVNNFKPISTFSM